VARCVSIPGVTPRERLLANLDVIDDLVGFVRRRHHLQAADAEDFASYVKLALIEDDYRMVREFRGEARFRTYLVTVIQRLYVDFRNEEWGRWRPSPATRRLGPVAVALETLLVRDRVSLDAAHRHLTTALGLTVSRTAVEELVAQLPRRDPSPRIVDEPVPETTDERAPSRDGDDGRRRLSGLAEATLADSLARLADQDRLLLKLHYEDALSVAAISRALGLDQKRLYRHLKRLLNGLRRRLVEAGVGSTEANDLLAAGLEIALEFDQKWEFSESCQSHQVESGASSTDDEPT